MRRYLFISLLISFSSFYSQLTVDCSTSNLFCSDESYTFPNQTNTVAPVGLDYGCVGLTNNPVWYYLEIATGGPVELNLAQNSSADGTGTGIDTDFIMWGPYSSQTDACVGINNGDSPIQTGYSVSYEETIGIGTLGGSFLSNTSCIGVSTPPSASSGDVYVIMITNYQGISGYVTLSQTGGTGATDCNPTSPCNVVSISSNIGCADNGSFNISGGVVFTNPPSNGTLTISSTHGGSQVFNAPFSSPTTYSLNGLNSDGLPGSITASFSEDITCLISESYLSPTEISLALNSTPSSCNVDDGTLTIIASGGSGNYSYSISDPVNLVSTNNFTGLSVGSYNILVEDANGCQQDSIIEILGLSDLTPVYNTVDPICNNNDGKIAMSVTGGTLPLSYSINNSTYVSITDTIFNLSPGGYELVIKDGNNCLSTPDSVYLLDNSVSIDSINSTNITCIGQTNGIIDIYASGGISALEYSIDGGVIFNSSVNYTGLDSGQYDILVQDNIQCSSSQSVAINSPSEIQGNPILDTTVCVGGNVTSTTFFSGGTGIINYDWGNGFIGDTIELTVFSDTTLTVFGIDENGCISTNVVQDVFVYSPLSLVMSENDSICLNDFTTISGAASGGIGSGYIYSWENGLFTGSSISVNPSSTQSYTLTLSDGCGSSSVNGVVEVVVNPLPVVDFTADIIQGCVPLTVNFSETISTSMGNCSWDFGNQTTSTQSVSTTNTYSSEGCWDVLLTYVDSLNCSNSKTLKSFCN